jgi:hypothetical protein
LLPAGEGEALTRKTVELALAGDPAALPPCLERIPAVYTGLRRYDGEAGAIRQVLFTRFSDPIVRRGRAAAA